MAICRICRRKRRKDFPLMPLRVEGNLNICYDCYPVYREVNNILTEFVEGFVAIKPKRCRKSNLPEFQEKVRELRLGFFSQILVTIQHFNGDTFDHRANNFTCLDCMEQLSIAKDKLSRGLNNENQRLKKIKYWSIILAKIIKNNNRFL